MPEDFGEEYVLVNIPAFELFAYRNGELALEMRVVVGKPMHATPIFADEIELVVFRPYWNVPPSIALDEILPNVAADPDYLTRKNYEIVRLGGKSDPLDAEAVRRGLARIRQLPGPGNALGLVKFLFPNNHHVYLHDTPSDHLFDASRRAFSHGCIRLDRPAAFAKYVLEGSWSEEEIRGAMHGRTRRSVRLREKIPVFIAYTTAWVSADGRVHFRRDLYGHDASLARELEAHRKRDAAWRPLVARRMRRFLDSARPGDSVRQIVP